MDANETSKVYISISDHVISKIRSELVSNGELKLSLLNELHAIWRRKMIQAGVISGTIETEPSPPGYTEENAETGICIDPKELEMFIDNEHDGYGDTDALFPSTEPETFTKNEQEGFYIPQKDGSGDGDDDADIKPNLSAPPPTNEDDEELNENDDDVEDEEGGINDDNIQHLILCQFDDVKRKKNKRQDWECKLKAGVMHINGKQILFSEAKGDFDFV